MTCTQVAKMGANYDFDKVLKMGGNCDLSDLGSVSGSYPGIFEGETWSINSISIGWYAVIIMATDIISKANLSAV